MSMPEGWPEMVSIPRMTAGELEPGMEWLNVTVKPIEFGSATIVPCKPNSRAGKERDWFQKKQQTF